MRITLNFGGFEYLGSRTEHGDEVDKFLNKDNLHSEFFSYDDNQAEEVYAKHYVDWFNSLFETHLIYISVFRSMSCGVCDIHTIEAECSETDYEKLRTLVVDHYPLEYTQWIKDAKRFRVGFVDESNISRSAEAIISVLLETVESDWWRYYNEHKIYETKI